ncbi:MAG: tRNA (adenine-N(6)-)-methyltransferase [Clostridia bacterium]|nr:tRNA (adenine-N(6)-)-methyltransferase [Clostridia bacterium]MBR1653714.1 tRNA (adenine-N(6)-)-methyltransferase [Clostridia bacterium]
MKKAMIDYMQNIKNDELYTPEYAVKPLLKYLPKNAVIWECTDFGSSNITKVLRNNGFKVVNTNKAEIDFLEDNIDFYFDMIITNPPYSLKDEFIKKCYEYKKPFALLLPITSLEGIERGKMFRKNGIELLVFDRRCNFIYDNAKKSNWFNTSWFCYNILPKQLIFEELKKDE